MASGDVALEIVGIRFSSGKETTNNRTPGASPVLQETSGGGGVDESYAAVVTVSHEVGGQLSVPSLYDQLDPSKQYTVKIIEQ